MSDTQKHTKPNVPNLRFPGFEGEWKEYKNERLFSISKEKNKSREYHTVLSASQTEGMVERDSLGIDIKYEAESVSGYKVVRPGEYVIHLRSFQGGFAFSDTTGICSPAYTILHPAEVLSYGFLREYFMSQKFIDSLRLVTYGIRDGKSISVEEWMKLKTYIPKSFKEQERIKKFLDLIDKRITIQNKIIEDLKLIKNSITRSLLNRHDESGRIVSLGEITEVVSRRNKGREVFPMYSVTNDRGFIPQTEQFEDREMVGEDISAYKIVHNGEIAYNPARINVGSIAQYTGKESCMISSLYICLKVKPGVLSNWLIQVLRCEQMKNYYNLYAEGGVRLYLFYPIFSKIKIYLPTIEQQKRIASVLEAIEAKISLECSILARYQASKQALLMKLFI